MRRKDKSEDGSYQCCTCNMCACLILPSLTIFIWLFDGLLSRPVAFIFDFLHYACCVFVPVQALSIVV